MRVLVVDDDNLVAISLKTILEADPEVAVIGIGKSGEDAVCLYREQKPDVLLMDIRMNG
ncbi:MAG: response regulator, partial [Clostridiales bacterium]|nr:response regulator [Clostridiales bacterium]MDY4113361.1 response regulator [Roseburia sp.]